MTIRHAVGSDGKELDWSHNGGVARAIADELVVSLGAGEWVAYDFEVPSTSRYLIVVALKGDGAVSLAVDGSPVEGLTDQLTPGRHVVRLTGLAPETLVGAIEIRSADGPPS